MTREMAEQMKGEDAARELAQTCLDEFDRWAQHAPADVAGLYPHDPEGAAMSALQDVRAELHDYLPNALATALTALRLQGEFDG